MLELEFCPSLNERRYDEFDAGPGNTLQDDLFARARRGLAGRLPVPQAVPARRTRSVSLKYTASSDPNCLLRLRHHYAYSMAVLCSFCFAVSILTLYRAVSTSTEELLVHFK